MPTPHETDFTELQTWKDAFTKRLLRMGEYLLGTELKQTGDQQYVLSIYWFSLWIWRNADTNTPFLKDLLYFHKHFHRWRPAEAVQHTVDFAVQTLIHEHPTPETVSRHERQPWEYLVGILPQRIKPPAEGAGSPANLQGPFADLAAAPSPLRVAKFLARHDVIKQLMALIESRLGIDGANEDDVLWAVASYMTGKTPNFIVPQRPADNKSVQPSENHEELDRNVNMEQADKVLDSVTVLQAVLASLFLIEAAGRPLIKGDRAPVARLIHALLRKPYTTTQNSEIYKKLTSYTHGKISPATVVGALKAIYPLFADADLPVIALRIEAAIAEIDDSSPKI